MLILIYMKTHAGFFFVIPIDQAGLGQGRPISNILPQFLQSGRQNGPRLTVFGVSSLIAVPFIFIRDPAQRAEITHDNGERRACARHSRLIKRGLRDAEFHGIDQ